MAHIEELSQLQITHLRAVAANLAGAQKTIFVVYPKQMSAGCAPAWTFRNWRLESPDTGGCV